MLITLKTLIPMFDSTTDFAGLHLHEIISANDFDPTLWSGYSDSLVPSVLPFPPMTAEVLESHSNSLLIDQLTGASLTEELLFFELPPIIDDSLWTAQDLGVLEGSQIIQGSVGDFNRNDVYRIVLDSPSNLYLSLEGLIADTDLELIVDFNGNGFVDFGEVIDFSNWGGTFPEYVSAVNLPPGDYFVNVKQYSGFTPYTLTLSPIPIPYFNPSTGYGLVDAAAAVSRGMSHPVAFADVPDAFFWNWGLNTINAPEVWSQGITGEGVVVAVIDSGVDYTHSALSGRIWQNPGEIPGNGIDDDGNGYIDDVIGWDFVDNNADLMDLRGHGTHVAGIIAAEASEFGIMGVAPNAQIMPIRVLDDEGRAWVDPVVSGIHYAVNNGADVINLSLGFEYDSIELQQAIQYATEQGVVVVSSAGNYSESSPAYRKFSPKYPAGYATDWGIAVGASNIYNQFADFSHYAGFTPINYVVAPGVDIYSTTLNNSYESSEGTSMAAPHVAGIVALMLSANPNLTPYEIQDILTQTTNPNGLIT